ncbi:MAG: hypothetical protein BWY74_02300 [Firmicutes bacterium ADurb.Bin419]|nr:MAG: hypothetical protein BWY74_02300 [Firmicutes bacterium ADurb.Bin419]
MFAFIPISHWRYKDKILTIDCLKAEWYIYGYMINLNKMS